MVEVVDAELVVPHHAQEQVRTTLVAECEGAALNLLPNPFQNSLQGGTAVVLGGRVARRATWSRTWVSLRLT